MTTVNLTTVGSSTWTVPANVYSITIQCLGAGGGGGTATGNPATGGGGSGGNYAKKVLTVVPNQVLNYTVGCWW